MISAPYKNKGNELVLSMIPAGARRVLDVGCGAGDNAKRLKTMRPDIEIVGLTHNEEEARMAAPYMTSIRIMDIEFDPLDEVGTGFDLIILSHVLEHLREPVDVLKRFLPLLEPDGHVLIAVPNLLEWRTRTSLMRGMFRYTDQGILDRTHLRFFTYDSAADALVSPISELKLIDRNGRGAAPLGPMRRFLFPQAVSRGIDRMAVRMFPNLFAGEVALLAVKESMAPTFKEA